jgi:hypothetical protein
MERNDNLGDLVWVRLRTTIIPLFSFVYVRVDDEVRNMNSLWPKLTGQNLGERALAELSNG